MSIFNQIINAVGNVIGSFFSNDMDVMSPEARRILSNPEDREKYMEAVQFLKEHPEKKQKEITLSNNEKLTLVS